jgi:integrase
MRLTDMVVKNLPLPTTGQQDYRDESLPGFMCRVSQGGTKTFVLIHGMERRRTTIGRYPILGLADARAEAKRILAERTLSRHRPVRLRASVALPRFLAEKAGKNKASTLKITAGLIDNHRPRLLLKYLEDIRTDDVTEVTDKLLKKGQAGAAAHSFTAIRTFLRWCVKRRYLQHSPVEGLDKPGHDVSRERVLSDDELHTVWQAADELGSHFGTIVKLLILTGQRRSEIGGLRTDYIQYIQICLPKEITKNSRTHTFPIGSTALALISPRLHAAQNSKFLFSARGNEPAPFSGWSKSKKRLDARIAIARGSEQEPSPLPPWTLHDLRRTYATGLQKLGVKLEVIEALLNHVSGTRAGIVGVYQRHQYQEEMREAVERWETHLQSILARA